MSISSQQIVQIDKIREGVLILKDKSIRGIMIASSINFILKSEEEREAIIYQFQNFLNSLDFTIQIYIQSRPLNITGYLEELKVLKSTQKDPLLRFQIKDYIKLIKTLVEESSIMSKNFLIVVPYGQSKIDEKRQKSKKHLEMDVLEENFQRAKTQLWQRMEFISTGLKRCGVLTFPLTSREIIELFWSIYNPQDAEVGYYPEIPPEFLI